MFTDLNHPAVTGSSSTVLSFSTDALVTSVNGVWSLRAGMSPESIVSGHRRWYLNIENEEIYDYRAIKWYIYQVHYL